MDNKQEIKKHRDQVMKKVVSDPRLKMEVDNMPFDRKRMICGGFKTTVAFGGKNGK